MNMTVNDQEIPHPLTQASILQQLSSLPPDEPATITLARSEKERLQAVGDPVNGFSLTYFGNRPGQTLNSANPHLKLASVSKVLSAFAAGDRTWTFIVGWSSPKIERTKRKWDIPPGLAAFVIFAGITTPVLLYTAWKGDPGAPRYSDLLPALGAIGAISLYIQYLDFFFRRVRPVLKSKVQLILGVRITEDLGLGFTGAADQWIAVGNTSFTKWLLVKGIDLVVLAVFTIGPVAIIGIPMFILAEWIVP